MGSTNLFLSESLCWCVYTKKLLDMAVTGSYIVNSKTVSSSRLLSSSKAVSYKDRAVEIPNSASNPFLQSSRFKQGTLYVIIFPIIFAFILIYILGAIIQKYRANKQARKIEPFDKDYEGIDDIYSVDDYNNDNELDPFNDRNEINPDFISQYRRSMDHLKGNLGKHTRNSSVGTILKIDLNSQPNLQPTHYQERSTQPPVYSIESNDQSYVSLPQGTADSASYFLAAEPSKQHPPPTSRSHLHSRSLSTQALDDFLSTGELPVPNTSYDIPVSRHSRSRSTSPQRSPQPRRTTVYTQQTSRNNSPSRSPVRSLRGV